MSHSKPALHVRLFTGALLTLATACSNMEPMPANLPCEEAGLAIARRTFECTSDGALANGRYHLFESDYRCVGVEVPDDSALPVVDLFHCAFILGELPCEMVSAYGDDLDAWFASSNACAWIIEHSDGSPLSSGAQR